MLYSGGHYASGEIVYAFKVVAIIKARRERRIATTIDDQVALDLSVLRLFFRVYRGCEVIVRRQSIERRGDRVQLHVRSRPSKFVRALFVNHQASIERDDLDREEPGFERRLSRNFCDARLQFCERGRRSP